MTIKRLILILLTVLAIVKVILSLGDSLSQPQVQSRLELYQTNLILHAAEFKPSETIFSDSNTDLSAARDALIGKDPYLTAEKQYQKAKKVAQTTLGNYETQLKQLASLNDRGENSELEVFSPVQAMDITPQQQQLKAEISDLNKFINEAELKLGILQAVQGQINTALTTWSNLIANNQEQKSELLTTEMAQVLQALWQNNSLKLENSESSIKNHLTGWFQYQSLKKIISSNQVPK